MAIRRCPKQEKKVRSNASARVRTVRLNKRRVNWFRESAASEATSLTWKTSVLFLLLNHFFCLLGGDKKASASSTPQRHLDVSRCSPLAIIIQLHNTGDHYFFSPDEHLEVPILILGYSLKYKV